MDFSSADVVGGGLYSLWVVYLVGSFDRQTTCCLFFLSFEIIRE